MQTNVATTPFGCRPMTLALLHTAHAAEHVPEGKAVDKWQLYRDLCEAKALLGVSDRSLAVLHALLSFYPDNELELGEGANLVVFPSNRQLSMRAHGMPDPTLRRHIAALVSAGLITRRDSPNGKRYAHKARTGQIEDAFGFSLAPLLARADEIAAAADEVRATAKALRRTRELITLQRRDIGKLIEVAIGEGLSGPWQALWGRYRAIVDGIPRRAELDQLNQILSDLTAVRLDVNKALENNDNEKKMNGNAAHSERQQSESNTESYIEFEPAFEKAGANVEGKHQRVSEPKSYPLGLVLKACPEIADYAACGISSWRDLMQTTAQVRAYLGISPSAYADALDILGQENTAIVIAGILQRSDSIKSPGGYLRALTDKARAGAFSVGPMLMAGLKAANGNAMH
ncbi:plasmid replication protein RepC [Acinetobacter baumannii]|uniref:plasmid replication protein RepC n=1 Tax=Acinetobacter baumannii TaxID=470 RepID=UPI0034E251F9